MKPSIISLLVLLGATQAWAAEPVGCDNFKWPVTSERAALAQTGAPKLASGGVIADTLPQTVVVELKPSEDAKLPSPPERAPKQGTFAGFSTLKNIPTNATYSISLSAGAWVDVLQNGNFLKPKAFSGVTGCDGIRKVMKFDLMAGPVIVQVSGVAEPAIKMAVMPVTE